MDIREISGLWCDDITFCQEKCDMRDCPRNQCNIRDHNIPHSFSVERPKDCPKEKVMPDSEKVIKELNDWIIYRCFLGSSINPTLVQDAIALLKSQPQIVRCKDCKYYDTKDCADGFGWCNRNGTGHGSTDDWFCADGERR